MRILIARLLSAHFDCTVTFAKRSKDSNFYIISFYKDIFTMFNSVKLVASRAYATSFLRSTRSIHSSVPMWAKVLATDGVDEVTLINATSL